MMVRCALLPSLLVLLLCCVLDASTLVIRDSIGPDSSLTDGLSGGSTNHDGPNWNTPGLVVSVPEDGKLTEAQFVIFARGPAPALAPENNLSNIYGYYMDFHIWSDGVQGAADSFDSNPQGLTVPGHIKKLVNWDTTSLITVVPFGHTGPASDPSMFTTFLVTVDLSSFNIPVEGGRQYVMGLIQDNWGNYITGGGFYRIIGSRATGFEDLFRSNTTDPAIHPGYINFQENVGFDQYAGSFTLMTYGPGDYDFDGDVDSFDYDKWRSKFGTNDSMADGNDDGTVDAADYVIWRKHLGEMAAAASQISVPEPATSAMIAFVGTTLVAILRRPSTVSDQTSRATMV